ncbi:serine protease, partial [Anaerotruncus colihominis]|nr:serine protease [Anaerotruncus colihominis]
LHILRGLYRTGSAPYESLFLTSTDRSELVATFLAVLELVKAHRITVDGGQVSFERGGRARQQQEAPT